MRLNPDTLGSPEATDEQQLAAALKQCQADDAREAVKQARQNIRALKEKRPELTGAERDEHNRYRNADPQQVLERLKATCPEAVKYAELCGGWIWISWPEKPSAEVRKASYLAGFSWSHKRGAWYCPCGQFTGHSKSDPRAKYGSVKIASAIPEGEEAPIIITELSPKLKQFAQAAVGVAHGNVL